MSDQPSVFDLYTMHFWHLINQAENASKLRDVLDIYHGDELMRALQQGELDVREVYPWLSEASFNLLTMCTQNMYAQWLEIEPIWEDVDHYDRYGTLEGLAAGVFSDETSIGAAIGSILIPGIGTAIGGAIGGMIAGNKIDKKANAAIDLLDSGCSQMIQGVTDYFNMHVLPSIKNDIERINRESHANSGGGVVDTIIGIVFIGLALAGVYSIGKWLWSLF